eukprot:TRINITY_DN508_c1_g1_i1.p1 TRINITY_DN508_c1_g1~~TRINITY_DN508_c1_g1_i1.p1  ORF type:complete len:257 (-),score=78.51 TRINITY_DN508_c1_g1_i1:252-1001(-)
MMKSIFFACLVAAVYAEAEPEAQYFYNGAYNTYAGYPYTYGMINRAMYSPYTYNAFSGYPAATYHALGKRSAEAEAEPEADAQYLYGNTYAPYTYTNAAAYNTYSAVRPAVNAYNYVNAAVPAVRSYSAAVPAVRSYSAAVPAVSAVRSYSAAVPAVRSYSAAVPAVSAVRSYSAAVPAVSAVSAYSAYPYATQYAHHALGKRSADADAEPQFFNSFYNGYNYATPSTYYRPSFYNYGYNYPRTYGYYY